MVLRSYWAMGELDQVMYQYPGEPVFLDLGVESGAVDISTHLANALHGNSYVPSQDITSDILSHQTSFGLSSDWVSDGLWMDSFNPVTILNNLDSPGSGVAWHLLTNKMFIGAHVQSTLPFQGLETGFQWAYGRTSLSIDLRNPLVDNYLLDDVVSISPVIFMGYVNNSDNTAPAIGSFVPIDNGYEHRPAYNSFNTLLLRPSTPQSGFNPLYSISADAFPEGSPGLFSESAIANRSEIQSALSHMADSSVHTAINDQVVSPDVAWSADFLNDFIRSSNLDMPPSGDSWSLDNTLYSPDTDITAISEYLAIGGQNLGYVEILHPVTNQVLATSVNGLGGIWAKFSLESGLTPVVPPGVALRKLNISTGYGRSIDF